MKRLASIAVIGALLLASACGKPEEPDAGTAPTVLNFSVLTTEAVTNLQSIWDPILADMEKEIGIPVKPFFATNYTALVEAMRFKQTDLGWFSNLPGLEAVRRSGGEVFAHTTDPSGTDGYASVIIVPAASKLTIEDLLKCDKTLDFGMGDAKSTSGTLAPNTYLFAPRGVVPANCFKTVRTTNHGANLSAVANGVLDAATNNSSGMLVQRERENEPGYQGSRIIDKVKVIWTSPSLPEDPMVWRKDLDPATKEKVRQFFLRYGKGDGAEAQRQRALLAKLTIAGFEPADDNHLLQVREMEASELYEQAKSSGDAAKTAEAKQSLDGIRGQIAALPKPT